MKQGVKSYTIPHTLGRIQKITAMAVTLHMTAALRIIRENFTSSLLDTGSLKEKL
jgi:hypothetical protein